MESVLNISAHKYGNYHKYYTFHPSLTRSEIFLKYSKNLFYILWKNQNCPEQFVILDIGCNEGNLSVEILNQARLQIPSYVSCILLGIDIDKNLIDLANNKYCYHYHHNHDNSQHNKEIDTISGDENNNNNNNNNTFIYFYALDFMNIQLTNEYFIQFFHMIHKRHNSNDDTHTYQQQQQEQELCESHLYHLNQHENSQYTHNDNNNNNYYNKFNLISLFSITMWIHLNHGDDGLISCLNRSVSLLHTNGSLIIEPQLWKCYKNNNKRCRKLGIERTTPIITASTSTINNINNNNINNNSTNYFHVLKIRDDIDKHIIEILTNLSDNNNNNNDYNNDESLTSTPCIKHPSIESSIASTTVIDESLSVTANTDITTTTTTTLTTSSVSSSSNSCSRKIIKSYWNLGKENWGRSILIFHKSTTPIITSTDDDDGDNNHVESDVIYKDYKRCKTE